MGKGIKKEDAFFYSFLPALMTDTSNWPIQIKKSAVAGSASQAGSTLYST
jgi:hypothetical protein